MILITTFWCSPFSFKYSSNEALFELYAPILHKFLCIAQWQRPVCLRSIPWHVVTWQCITVRATYLPSTSIHPMQRSKCQYHHPRICDSFLLSWWVADAESWSPLLKSNSCTVTGRCRRIAGLHQQFPEPNCPRPMRRQGAHHSVKILHH